MATAIKNRRDTAANWTAINPIPLEGQLCIENDAGAFRLKVGDGVTPWNDLDYLDIGGANETAESILAKLLLVDGAGSGLDADKLDGQSSQYYEDLALKGALIDITKKPYFASPIKTGAENFAAITAAAAYCKNTRNTLYIPDGTFPVNEQLDLTEIRYIEGRGILSFTSGTHGVIVGTMDTSDPIMRTIGGKIKLTVWGNGTEGSIGITEKSAAGWQTDYEVLSFDTTVKNQTNGQYNGYNLQVHGHYVGGTYGQHVEVGEAWYNQNVMIATPHLHNCLTGIFLDNPSPTGIKQADDNLWLFPCLEGSTTSPMRINGGMGNIMWLPRIEACGPFIFEGKAAHNHVILRPHDFMWPTGVTYAYTPSDWPNFVYKNTGLEFDEVINLTYEDFIHLSATANRHYACTKNVTDSNTGKTFFDYMSVSESHKSFTPGTGSNDSLWIDIPVNLHDIFIVDFILYNESALASGDELGSIIALDASKTPLANIVSGASYLCASPRFDWGGSSASGNTLVVYNWVSNLFSTFKVSRSEVKYIRILGKFGIEYVNIKVRKVRDFFSSRTVPKPVGFDNHHVLTFADETVTLPIYVGQAGIKQTDNSVWMGVCSTAGVFSWKRVDNVTSASGLSTKYQTTSSSGYYFDDGTLEFVFDLASVDTSSPNYIQFSNPSIKDGDIISVRFGGTITAGNPVFNDLHFASAFSSGWVTSNVLGAPSGQFLSGQTVQFLYTTTHPSFPSGCWICLGVVDVSSWRSYRAVADGLAPLDSYSRLPKANSNVPFLYRDTTAGNIQPTADNMDVLLVDPATPLAGSPYYIQLPQNPVDGQLAEVVYGGSVAFGKSMTASASNYLSYASGFSGSWITSNIFNVPEAYGGANNAFIPMSGDRHLLRYQTGGTPGWYFLPCSIINKGVKRETTGVVNGGGVNVSTITYKTLVLDPASGTPVGTYNVNLVDASPKDGDTLKILGGGTVTSGDIVTAVTVTPTAGALVPSGTFAVTVGTAVTLTYSAAANKWYRT